MTSSQINLALALGYLVLLLILGLAGRWARKENSLADFYLGSRNTKLFVLFLTLYATQYSGNTLIGFAGKAYRQGYGFLVSVAGMLSVVGGFMIFAKKIHRLSREHDFITPSDFVEHRFKSKVLTLSVTLVFIVTLANYILTNLKAMGYIVETVSQGQLSYSWGIIVLSFIMVIYETLGGFRSIAWTDVIQGILLLIGALGLLAAIQIFYGGMSETASILQNSRPELFAAPSLREKTTMFSTILIFFFGASVYPHMIQRFFAAESEESLRKSLKLMCLMPFVTTLVVVMIGIVGIAQFPNLSTIDSDKITLVILDDITKHYTFLKIVTAVFVTAVIAAIMSTVDSALLSLSSFFTKNIYYPLKPNTNEAKLTKLGKIFSWIIMGLMAYLAIKLPQTIWSIIEIKIELACQLAPIFFLGIHSNKVTAKAMLIGLISGCFVTLLLLTTNLTGLDFPKRPFGIHAGIWGLSINFLLILFYTNRASSFPIGIPRRDKDTACVSRKRGSEALPL